MTRRALAAAVLALVLSALSAAALGARARSPVPPAEGSRRAPSTPLPEWRDPPAPARNPFAYDDAPRVTPPPAGPSIPARALPAPVVDAPPSPPSPRVVGVVRRAGRAQAVLRMAGESALVGEGGEAFGVRVLKVGVERVLVRTADGQEREIEVGAP